MLTFRTPKISSIFIFVPLTTAGAKGCPKSAAPLFKEKFNIVLGKLVIKATGNIKGSFVVIVKVIE